MLPDTIKVLTTDLLLFVSIIAAFTYVMRWTSGRRPIVHQLMVGATLGAAAILAMMMPVQITPGVYLDGRSVVLALTAPFGGVPGMLIAGAMAGAYRLLLGGAGTLPALASMTALSLSGLLIMRRAAARGRMIEFKDLLLFAPIAATIPLCSYVLLFDLNLTEKVLREIWAPLSATILIGVPILGALLIGERKHQDLQRKLADSERMFDGLVSNLPGIVYRRVLTSSGELRYEYLSQGIGQLYGVSRGEASADSKLLLDAMHSDDRARFDSTLRASAETLTPWALDYRILNRGGCERWMRARATPHRRDNGDTVWDGVVIDITDQKQAEAVQRSANEQLQHEIAQRTVAEAERDRLIKELEHLSSTDALTGVLNRRGLSAAGDHEFKRARRSGGTIGLILVDLDHFKRINDRHGHDAGDRVLQKTALACQSAVREVDCVARVGGEEFAILLPDADEAAALTVAMRLRGELERIAVLANGERIQVTASMGISAASGGTASLSEMMKVADGALYQAKEAGRNRIICGARAPAAPAEPIEASKPIVRSTRS